MKQLRPYQAEGAAFLASRKTALLADGMRVGKTAAAIGGADLIGAEDILWLTTGSARSDHAFAFDDFEKYPRGAAMPIYSGNERIPFSGTVITSYALATGALRERLMKRRFDLCVLDEAHALKEPASLRTMSIYGEKLDLDGGLAGQADRTWLLTGTPTPNHNAELFTHLRALYPEAVIGPKTGRPWSYLQFRLKYCKLKSNGWEQKIVGSKNFDLLKEKIAPFHLRRTLRDVRPDMPAMQFDVLPLDAEFRVPASLAPEAAEVERVLREEGFDGLAKASPHSATLRRYTGLAKVEPVADWVRDQFDGGMTKLVLFAVHTEVVRGLVEALHKRGFRKSVVSIEGATPPKARDARKEMFQTRGDCRIMVGQIDACGEAVDFSAADEELFVEQSWSGGVNEQAAYRILNVNKAVSTLARVAMFAGSYDDNVSRVVVRKLEDSSALWD